MPNLYLGVDGGGTKCRMRLADENLETLGEAVTETPANLQVRDGASAYEAIGELLPEVFAEAGVDLGAAARTYACLGMAGARLQSARDDFARRRFPFAGLQVLDDIDIARAGAHDGADGAVIIIGTGSAGLALIAGERHQVGGWGFFVGDSMSGAILGRELLRCSLLAHEGLRPSTDLSRTVMARFGNDPNRLMSWSFDNPDARADARGSAGAVAIPARPSDYGEFAPLVFEHLDKGDELAAELLRFELDAVDDYIDWFRSRGAPAIAIVGGLGERLYPRLRERYGALIVAPRSEPLHGALILARQTFPPA